MNSHANDLSPRNRTLVDAVRRLQEYDKIYGDPTIPAACAGELQRVLLKYISKSPRRVGPAEHAALDQVLHILARVGCGPVVLNDLYIEGSAFLAVAAEAAVAKVSEARPVDRHEQESHDEEQVAEELVSSIEDEAEALRLAAQQP